MGGRDIEETTCDVKPTRARKTPALQGYSNKKHSEQEEGEGKLNSKGSRGCERQKDQRVDGR